MDSLVFSKGDCLGDQNQLTRILKPEVFFLFCCVLFLADSKVSYPGSHKGFCFSLYQPISLILGSVVCPVTMIL